MTHPEDDTNEQPIYDTPAGDGSDTPPPDQAAAGDGSTPAETAPADTAPSDAPVEPVAPAEPVSAPMEPVVPPAPPSTAEPAAWVSTTPAEPVPTMPEQAAAAEQASVAEPAPAFTPEAAPMPAPEPAAPEPATPLPTQQEASEDTQPWALPAAGAAAATAAAPAWQQPPAAQPAAPTPPPPQPYSPPAYGQQPYPQQQYPQQPYAQQQYPQQTYQQPYPQQQYGQPYAQPYAAGYPAQQPYAGPAYGTSPLVAFAGMVLVVFGIGVALIGAWALTQGPEIGRFIRDNVIALFGNPVDRETLRTILSPMPGVLMVVGLLLLVSGAGVFAHKSWARWLGVLLSALGLLVAVVAVSSSLALAPGLSIPTLISVVLLVGFAFILLALFVGGSHFRRRRPAQG